MVRQVRHSPHPQRVYDARQATHAARTLAGYEETILLAGKRYRGLEANGLWVDEAGNR